MRPSSITSGKPSTLYKTPLQSSILTKFWRKVQLWYYQYEVTFCPYLLTPVEKTILNTIVVLLISLLVFSIVTYLPPLFTTVFARLYWIYLGTNNSLMVVNGTAWHGLELGLADG
jgi:hypothetical protein